MASIRGRKRSGAEAHRAQPRRTDSARVQPRLSARRKARFHSALLDWFCVHGRRYPWRTRPTPYGVFISDFMLQRTGASQVVPVYRAFLRTFPTLKKAANASVGQLRRILQPLGRVERAPVLKRALDRFGTDFHSRIPGSIEDLRKVPGIGEYTARAIACFGYKKQLALLDPNIYRLLSRAFGVTSQRERIHTDPGLWRFMDGILPASNFSEFNLAMLDLGATICRSRAPRCFECPLSRWCAFRNAGAKR